MVNVSGMSFGALGSHALSAINKGAAMAGAYHDTGEGGLSPYHLLGADVVVPEGWGGFRTSSPVKRSGPGRSTVQAIRARLRVMTPWISFRPWGSYVPPATRDRIRRDLAATLGAAEADDPRQALRRARRTVGEPGIRVQARHGCVGPHAVALLPRGDDPAAAVVRTHGGEGG